MLRLIPRKRVILDDPLCRLWQYSEGWICDSQHGKRFGIEDAGKYHTVYDLNAILPKEYLTEDTWSAFIDMVIRMIPAN
eukprot:4449492-Karenia_brevis.AAC.1